MTVRKTHRDAVDFTPVDWTGLYPPKLPRNAVPEHVAIVMDGNGRWANGKGLTRVEGHKAGKLRCWMSLPAPSRSG